MGDTGWKKFVADLTNSSTSEVSRAGHVARDDMASSGQLSERNINKVSDSPEGREIASWLEQKKDEFLKDQ